MIDVTFAVMGSQKTAQMMMQIHHLRSQGHHVAVLKPSKDTRDGAFLSSRAPIEPIPCETFGGMLQPLYGVIGYACMDRPTHLFIDEVNFMTPDEVTYAVMYCNEHDIHLHLAGLLTDFREEMFPGSKRALELCDTYRTLTTPCKCGEPATRNMRLLDGEPIFTGEQIQVGGDESYLSVCRKCYNKAKAEKRVRRTSF